ncbi:MAG: ABC transporter ATP-binding protein [Oscillospiraceae bacterium]|jgi:multidrug/hemolysin transport system ATP-binding protein|nr:ABC transporter ATP-binding protein [Oscillospiraceae bacterium]
MAENIITVANLTKSYGAAKAVDDLSFSVPAGSLFAFLGQNGAGKSTTINALLELAPKDGGTIVFDGNRDFAQFRPHIGVVFQNNVFDDFLTVEENLLLYGQLYLGKAGAVKPRYNEIAETLGLAEYAKKQFRRLSGGQKRKAEIARALLTRPRLLFLDEPTTGLDPRTRAEVWSIIHSIRRESGMTVFLTTHYMEETSDADKVVVIHRGRLVCEGSPAELKARYSSDRLLLTPVDAALLEAELTRRNLPYTKTADTYAVLTTDTARAIALLNELSGNLRWFEAARGSMDDVFLNAVGEQIEGERV